MESFSLIATIAGSVVEVLRLPGGSVLGAFVLYILHRHNDKQPFSMFKALNIDVSNAAGYQTILADMVCSSLLGGIVVYFITEPVTMPQAIVAGLGMTGILSSHSK